MGPSQGDRDPATGRSSANIHSLHRRLRKYELLGKALSLEDDVTSAQKRTVHHPHDVEDPQQCRAQLL